MNNMILSVLLCAGIAAGCLLAGKILLHYFQLESYHLSFDLRERDIFLVHIIAGALLVVAGMRMLFLAFERKTLVEHRMDEIDVRHDAILGIRLCLLSLMAGVALGLLEYSLKEVLLVIGCMSVCFTAAGYFAGRAYGVGLCRRAYMVSGALLCAAGVLVQLPGA